ncbi:hypothetical protein IAQ61_009258 [Plenodomus lingam]|uniref:uncharacterized protein n=1 Tax=Leptosphaeria maculans TaxID=5022 RepID=UPI003317ECCA|nr:hypothetical protein IAQ61_009258 [Plenodomus lingam]
MDITPMLNVIEPQGFTRLEKAEGVWVYRQVDEKTKVTFQETFANLDSASLVGQFALGRFPGMPGWATGTDIVIDRPWHQTTAPHITVYMRYIKQDA